MSLLGGMDLVREVREGFRRGMMTDLRLKCTSR